MKVKLRFTFFLITFLFLTIIGRLFYWQIIKGEDLSALGRSQYGGFIRVLPQRGEIKTSDNFPIAANKVSFLVFANPKAIENKENTSKILADSLDLQVSSVSALLSQNLLWVPVKQKVDIGKKEDLEKINIKGIGFEKQPGRFYPEASMAAHLLGFVGKDELGEDKGYFGIEGYYDRQLKGKTGITMSVQDALGRPILSKMNDNLREIDGRNLILNIERPIQFLAEKRLKEGIKRYEASGGAVLIMEPKTGNIVAMASFPSFDPSSYGQFSSENFKSPLISNLYEPGSTFKALVMASALDADIVKPQTKCPVCGGPFSMGGYTIKTWNDKYYKDTSMIEIIQHSDNVGMVYVARSLGLKNLLSYLRKFGIGDLTGIDLQGEVSADLKPEKQWYPLDLATAGFGQGISVTPIQLLTAFASIANGGKRMEPHVVSKIQTSQGEIIDISPKVVDKPISEKTARIMTEILVNAVNKGESQWVRVKGYRIAGKTGTAQIPIAGHYDPNKTITSFIGFGPADDPKFVMLVVIDRPTTSIYGSETAAPVFFSIAKDIINYYGIPPTE